MKQCSRCREEKPFTEFARSSSHKDGHQSYCKSCRRSYWQDNRDRLNANRNASARERGIAEAKSVYMAKYRADNKDRLRAADRARHILRHYGLTIEAYETLLAGGCILCSSTENLHIDHDHSCCPGKITCGKCVRGVLCRSHNTGLGLFSDDPAMLRLAADYVERTQQ
jgi:hypothetical protein